MSLFLHISRFTNLFMGSKRMLLPGQSRSILVSVEEGCWRIYLSCLISVSAGLTIWRKNTHPSDTRTGMSMHLSDVLIKEMSEISKSFISLIKKMLKSC